MTVPVFGVMFGHGFSVGSYFMSCVETAARKLGAVKDRDFPKIVLLSIVTDCMAHNGSIVDQNKFMVEAETASRVFEAAGVTDVINLCVSLNTYTQQMMNHSNWQFHKLDAEFPETDFVFMSKVAYESKAFDSLRTNNRLVAEKLIDAAQYNDYSTMNAEFNKLLQPFTFSHGSILLGCTDLSVHLNWFQNTFHNEFFDPVADMAWKVAQMNAES